MLQVLHRYPQTDVLRLRPPSVLRLPNMTLLDLNNDVLTMILSFVRPPDAIQLALTCHDAYTVAMPRFLSEVVLGCPDSSIMGGPQQITLFCEYMLADVQNRMRHLKVLEIKEGAFVVSSEKDGRETWVQDFSCAPLLTDMLREAVNLRKLYIRDLEPLLASQPGVADALSNLHRLCDVSFFYIGKCTLEMLKHTTCRPHRLEFGMWKDGSSRVAGDTAAFHCYAPSLQTLNLWQCACLLESLGEDYVSHGVRVLGLGGRIPLLSTVSREFPNVHTITFAPECSVEEESPTAYWSALDYVDTSMPLPFFSCSVRRLELRYVLGAALIRFSQSAVVSRTVELLRQTSPVVLSCVMEPTLESDTITKIVNVIPKLRYLELQFSQREPRMDDDAHDIEYWMNQHIPRFGKVPLMGLLLTGTLRKRGENVAEIIDRVAHFAATHIQSLKVVGVGLPAKGQNHSRHQRDPVWFRVKMRMDEGEPMLEKLSSEEGEIFQNRLRALDRPISS